MSAKSENPAVVFTKIPETLPVPGEHLKVQDIGYDASAELPADSVALEVLFVSLDPYQRGRMRSAEVKSYFPAFTLNEPIDNAGLAKVLKSTSDKYKEGDTIRARLPYQKYVTLEVSKLGPNAEKLDVQNGPEDLRHWLGALGMPGLTAYSGLFEIGKPQKGETIFISSAAGAVGQLAGQLAKHQGLTVIGSVGSDDKLEYLTKELGFDGGFNYKKEKASDALKRLAPQGIDIYFENVGGEQLEAAIQAMNQHGRIIACGMISQYSLPADKIYGIKNLMLIVGRRITMQGFIVGDKDFGQKYGKEHREKVGGWLKDGTMVAKVHETTGIENGPEGFVGMLKGDNFGKAVLKI